LFGDWLPPFFTAEKVIGARGYFSILKMKNTGSDKKKA